MTLKPPSQTEKSVTTFFFALLVTSGLIYTLTARFHFTVPWFLIPLVALAFTGFMYWRARVRRGASPTDHQPPQNQ
jgi:hypothetical protein